MGADADDGVRDLVALPEQFDGHGVAAAMPRSLRDADDAVGPHQRHERAGSAGHGRGNEIARHAPELHADELFLAEA